MVRFPGGIELHARGEYRGGHFLYDNIGNYLARHGQYPPCEDAYHAIDDGETGGLTAWQRFWCVPRAVPPDEGPIYPADFFRFRELTLRAPVPGSLLRGTATVSLSARDFWTWRHQDFLLFDPEMAGSDGMHARVRMIDAHLPVPAKFVLSVRVTR
jgi:hypothetical protein